MKGKDASSCYHNSGDNQNDCKVPETPKIKQLSPPYKVTFPMTIEWPETIDSPQIEYEIERQVDGELQRTY